MDAETLLVNLLLIAISVALHMYVAYFLAGPKAVRAVKAWLMSEDGKGALVEYIKGALQYQKDPESPSLLGMVAATLVTYFQKVLGGAVGRANRQTDALAVQLAASSNPMIAAVAGMPGGRKFLSNPLVQMFAGPIIEKLAQQAAAMGSQMTAGQPPPEAPPGAGQ